MHAVSLQGGVTRSDEDEEMPNTIHKTTQCASFDRSAGFPALRFAKSADREEQERAAKDVYLPMDVFVDPECQEDAFHLSSPKSKGRDRVPGYWPPH